MSDPKSKTSDQQVLATALMKCVEETFTSKGNLAFSNTPEFKARNIIEYDSKMQVSGLEKFNDPAYVAAVNFYLTEELQKKRDTCGAIIAFVEEDSSSRLLKALGYSGFKDEDEDLIMDKCGEFCSFLAEKFKEELGKSGFKSFLLSAPVKGKNNVPGGIDFPYHQYTYHEASFYVWKKKIFVVDVVMSPEFS